MNDVFSMFNSILMLIIPIIIFAVCFQKIYPKYLNNKADIEDVLLENDVLKSKNEIYLDALKDIKKELNDLDDSDQKSIILKQIKESEILMNNNASIDKFPIYLPENIQKRVLSLKGNI